MTIAKDPKVTVASDSEDCFVFVKIDEANMKTAGNYSYFTYGVNTSNWTQLKDAKNNDVAGMYYRKVMKADTPREFYVLTGNADITGCANGCVVVSNAVTKADMDALKVAGATQPKLTFTAYAHQLYETNGAEFNPYVAWQNASTATYVSGANTDNGTATN